MPRVAAHAHKLKRHKYKSTGTAVFFCVLPDCSYRSDTHLTLGKRSICWRCGKEFKINEYSIRLARPHCNSCTKSKEVVPVPVEKITKNAAIESANDLKTRLTNTISAFAAQPDNESEDL